jgi:hypothetical protein
MIELCSGLKGMVFDDRGYISKAKAETLEAQGLKLITTLKKNMKKISRTKEEREIFFVIEA